jgi:hypothetical protein
MFDGFDAIDPYYCSVNARDLDVFPVGKGGEIPGHLNGAREGDRTAIDDAPARVILDLASDKEKAARRSDGDGDMGVIVRHEIGRVVFLASRCRQRLMIARAASDKECKEAGTPAPFATCFCKANGHAKENGDIDKKNNKNAETQLRSRFLANDSDECWSATSPHSGPLLCCSDFPVALVGPRASVRPTICYDLPLASRTMILPTPSGAVLKDGRVFGETPKTAGDGMLSAERLQSLCRLRSSILMVAFPL